MPGMRQAGVSNPSSRSWNRTSAWVLTSPTSPSHHVNSTATTGEKYLPGTTCPYTQVVELPDNTKLSTSALHVAQELDPDLFRDYLRRLRIAALAEGRNIEDRELLVELAGEVGFDTYEFEENWYGDIDDMGEFEAIPIIHVTIGDHEIPWSGHLEYGLAYGVLLDNDVLPVGDSSTYDQLVGEYGPITTTEIADITGDDREQIKTELEEREDVVRVEYGDAGFWDQA